MIKDFQQPRETPEEKLRRLTMRLENSRAEHGTPLTAGDFESLARARVRDFSQTSFASGLTVSSLPATAGSPYNFAETKFEGIHFFNCDLRNADFTGSDLTYVRFRKTDTGGANFSTIRINNSSIDLAEGAKQLTKQSPFSSSPRDSIIIACKDAERRFRRIFGEKVETHSEDPSPKNASGEGMILKFKGEVLGVLKLYVENSFLATQTIHDAEGSALFWKGGLYAVESEFAQFLMVLVEMRRPRGPRAWPVVDLDEALAVFRALVRSARSPDRRIGITLLRFLRDPSLFEKLPKWHKILESSTNTISLGTNKVSM